MQHFVARYSHSLTSLTAHQHKHVFGNAFACRTSGQLDYHKRNKALGEFTLKPREGSIIRMFDNHHADSESSNALLNTAAGEANPSDQCDWAGMRAAST